MQSQIVAPSVGQRSSVPSLARKTRQRISYVLPLANATPGHRLGVNGLAFDSDKSILYTAGRDGVIYSWNSPTIAPTASPIATSLGDSARPAAFYRQHVQAHTHWINDIVLVGNNTALVSASSDNSVKVWRPDAEDVLPPQTLGLHNDYAKCLAAPGRESRWVASGGLDRKISLWDLERGGQKLQIQSSDDEISGKGSVYALCTNENLIVSGGPESVVKVWDVRSGKRVTQFVGHTDNIRSVLISQDSEIIISASSDQTVKVWSVVGGRNLHTLTMHNDSVWCLYSDHPQLSVFYSGDRAGFTAKTDTRGALDVNDGLSIALCQEDEGVSKIVASENSVWTATASSSVNRWANADTTAGLQLPDTMNSYRWSASARSRTSVSSVSPISPGTQMTNKIPLNCILRISNSANWPPLQLRTRPERSLSQQTANARKGSVFVEPEVGAFEPLRATPEGTIQGQNGLTRHILLNDRRRALTIDTAGEVMLWDLLLCTSIKSFGKRPLDDVVPEVNSSETVAHWCNVDTRTGMLRCSLEESHCFDAEMYADELKEAEYMSFREDQRINLGKWVLRYLFATLLDEEIRRDEAYRAALSSSKSASKGSKSQKPHFTLEMPPSEPYWVQAGGPTPRAQNGTHLNLKTPGLAIGLASPSSISSPNLLRTTNGTLGDDSLSHFVEKAQDYFSSRSTSPEPPRSGAATPRIPATPSDGLDDRTPLSPSEPEKKETGFKKFRLSFAGKKHNRTQTSEAGKASGTQTREDGSESSLSKAEEPVFESSFLGTVQRIRSAYRVKEGEFVTSAVETLILPALPHELPVLKPPFNTTVIIQEESSDSAGMQDLYEGQIGNLGRDADRVERVAPGWLGDVLLRNRIVQKDVIKISFTLEPYDGDLPIITANEGSERLNANRMLRAHKILAYAADKLEQLPATNSAPAMHTSSATSPTTPTSATRPTSSGGRPLSSGGRSTASGTRPTSSGGRPASSAGPPSPSSPRITNQNPQAEAIKPADWLELYCQDKPVPLKMTLATIRTQMWKGGSDVALFYKVKAGALRPPGLIGVGAGTSAGAQSGHNAGAGTVAGAALAATRSR